MKMYQLISVAFLLSLVYCIISAIDSSTTTSCQNGEWALKDQIEKSVYMKLNRMYGARERKNSTEVLSSLCPAETLKHNCYFNGMVERALKLDNREWFTSDNNCNYFWPADFLSKFRGRTIVLYGDSVIAQVWEHLVCSLYQSTPVKFYIEWFDKAFAHADKLCITGAEHCFIGHALAVIPSFQIMIKLDHYYGYDEGSAYSLRYHGNIINVISNNYLTSKDIVIMNFGLHYNEPEKFLHSLRKLQEDLYAYAKKENDSSVPSTFFLETTPQHFGNHSAGYFSNEEEHKRLLKRCVKNPLDGVKDVNYTKDWRNWVLHEELRGKRVPGGLKIIEINRDLLSQWDSHIDMDSDVIPYEFPDCTHYCTSSGAMRFIQRKIYNALIASNLSKIETESKYFPNLPILKDGNLLRPANKREIYLLSERKLHQFYNGKAFTNRGFDFDNVIVVSEPLYLNSIEFGEVLI